MGAAAWPFTVDDAYIVARHAESLASGRGWAMNAGEPSDGVTGPLWVLPMALAIALGLSPIAAAKGLGLGCGAIAAGLTVRALGRRQGGRVAGAVAAAVLVAQGNLTIWSAAGLETGAATLALTIAALAASSSPRVSAAARESSTPRLPGSPHARASLASRRTWVVATCVGLPVALLAWLRPETFVAGVVCIAVVAARDRRAGVTAGAIAALGVASVVAFRLALFDHVLPLSFHAKPAELDHGAAYVARGLPVITGVIGLVPALVAVRRGGFACRVLGAVVVAHLAAVVVAGGDWMPGFRLLAPVVPAWAYLAGVGTGHLLRTRAPRARALAVLCAVAAVAVPALDAAVQLPDAREAGARREREGRELARYLREHADTVALVDAGYLAWASGVRVIDLSGLTDGAVARAPGAHLDKEIDPGWLAARAPDLIVLHASLPPPVDDDGNLTALAGFAVERRIAAMPWVRAHYRVARVVEYAPQYHYVVLARPRR